MADPLPAEQRTAGGGDTNVALKDTSRRPESSH